MTPKRKLVFKPPPDKEANESTDGSDEDRSESSRYGTEGPVSNRTRSGRAHINRPKEESDTDDSEEEDGWFEWVSDSYKEFSNDMEEKLR